MKNNYCACIKDHPAFIAWSKLQYGRPTPKKIELLTRIKRKRIDRKSTVYRIQGVGIDDSNVIAKNSMRKRMLTERYIYQEILPMLPLTSLHYYGFVEDKENNSFWIFLEDAGGENYSESNTLHRNLASRWLGVLHGATGKMDLSETLPPIGTDDYLSYVHLARKNVLSNISNPSLQSDDVRLLEDIVEHCNEIERSWSDVESFCTQIPPCLVHSDFIRKNARVRIDEKGPSLLVYDWHRAGWGLPAEDVAGLEAYVYWQKILEYQPSAYEDVSIIKNLERIGMIFRYLAWISTTSFGLAYKWVEQTMQDLRYYEDCLSKARKLAGF